MASEGHSVIQRSKSYNDIDEQQIRLSRAIYTALNNRSMTVSEAQRRYRLVQDIGNRYKANIRQQPDYQQASTAYSRGRMGLEDAYQRMYNRQYLRRDYMRRHRG